MIEEWHKGIKQMHANERRLLAHSYRELRRHNPAMARLVYRRSKEVMQRLMDEQLFGEGTCDLLNDFK